MSRVWNFCAGPAAIPEAVLEQAREELLDWHGRGLSVMEMSHRSPEIEAIFDEAERDLRDLLGCGDDYAVLFLQGGASLQFSVVPMNLLQGRTRAAYLETGTWSTAAMVAARRFCEVDLVASNREDGYRAVPPVAAWEFTDGAAYFHCTPNETIVGVEFDTDYLPPLAVPVVADLSSTILSRRLDLSPYGLIYAGAQKNIGPAGLCVVLVRRELLADDSGNLPDLLNYRVLDGARSMLNTPPTFAVYMAGLVFRWILQSGGLPAIEEHNRIKAELLYGCIDRSSFYRNPVQVPFRSRMNIPFTLAEDDLDGEFLRLAETNGLLNLKGHRLVGGMRASLYNAVPLEAVQTLVSFMEEFERTH